MALPPPLPASHIPTLHPQGVAQSSSVPFDPAAFSSAAALPPPRHSPADPAAAASTDCPQDHAMPPQAPNAAAYAAALQAAARENSGKLFWTFPELRDGRPATLFFNRAASALRGAETLQARVCWRNWAVGMGA
eukprot:83720-Chlamydomonas_euryale.AAC.2